MKIGVSMASYEGNKGPVLLSSGPLRKKIEMAKKLGYDGVDLFSNVTQIEEAREAGRVFRENNLEIALMVATTLSAEGVNLTDPDLVKCENSVRRYQEQIDIAQAMGARGMPVGYLRGDRMEGISEDAYEERLAQSLRQIEAYAGQRGIKIWLEPVNRYEINTMNSAEKTREFLRKYEISNVGLLLDVFHMNIEDNGIIPTILKCKGYIGHVHLPDNQRYACGSGCFDFQAILEALKETGFDGYVSVEAFPVFGEYESARMSIETLKEALAEQ
jgi:sugar phosphate isomerase/epimerase